MAHELDFVNDEAAMAFVGQTPWHGLGQTLEKGASIEEWQRSAHMDWEIFRTPVKYDVVNADADVGELMSTMMFEDKHVLYRSDNNRALSVVSPTYNIVQPHDVLEFYRELVGVAGMELETAGVLFGGRRFWALANTGKMVELAGTTVQKDHVDPLTNKHTVETVNIPDTVKGYLLLTTSCDGTLATTAQFTSIRVVCNNTLSIATKDNNNTRIRVPHNRVWSPNEVKEQLGFIDQGWQRFAEQIGILSERIATRERAVEFLLRLFGDLNVSGLLETDENWLDLTLENQHPAVKQKCADIWGLFKGEGVGSQMQSADSTWWGLVNAVTETMDYHTGHRTTDARLNNAWYGAGHKLKTEALELALTLSA